MFNLFFHDVKDAFKHSYHQVNRTVSLFAGISNGCSLFTFCYATFWMSAAPVCAQNYISRLIHCVRPPTRLVCFMSSTLERVAASPHSSSSHVDNLISHSLSFEMARGDNLPMFCCQITSPVAMATDRVLHRHAINTAPT